MIDSTRATTCHRFASLVTVYDGRRPTTAVSTMIGRLAAAGLDVTELDADGHDEPDLLRPAARRSVHVPLAAGSVGAGIAEHVASRDGALLVIDALGGGAAADRLRDDDVEHVLEHVVQPVMLLGPGAAPTELPATLVVPIDGSGLAGAALPVIVRWCHTFAGTTVVLLGLAAADPWPADASAPPSDDVDRAGAVLAEHGCAAAVDRPRSADTASLLVDTSREHGRVLVVAAPRWPGSATHWYSTARRLIRQASCPVLIVPADGPTFGGPR